MLAQERRVGLVPAELNQLLGRCAGSPDGLTRPWPGKSRRYAPERGKIGRHQVDLAANSLRLAWLEAADAEVGVKAHDHALKQFLIRLPRRRHQLLAVGRHAADQAARRNDRRERPRVDVVSADPFGAPHLARRVDRLSRPGRRGQPDRPAVHVNETARQISLGVVLGLHTRVPVDPDTRLSPVRQRLDASGVGRHHAKIDLVAPGSHLVLDDHTVVERRPQLDPPAVGAGLDPLSSCAG